MSAAAEAIASMVVVQAHAEGQFRMQQLYLNGFSTSATDFSLLLVHFSSVASTSFSPLTPSLSIVLMSSVDYHLQPPTVSRYLSLSTPYLFCRCHLNEDESCLFQDLNSLAAANTWTGFFYSNEGHHLLQIELLSRRVWNIFCNFVLNQLYLMNFLQLGRTRIFILDFVSFFLFHLLHQPSSLLFLFSYCPVSLFLNNIYKQILKDCFKMYDIFWNY